MNTRIKATLKGLSLSLAALAMIALGQNVARAEMVTFSTTGCFGAACAPVAATSTSGSGTAQANFAGIQPATTVNTSLPSGFTVADLGTITLSGVGTFSPTPFTLRVSQTAPTVGSGDFSGTLTGTLISGGSDARIVFSNMSLMIGSVTYQLNNLTGGNTLFLDTTSTGGITRISAQISAPAAIPEPATMILLGTGLAGAAGAVRRRRNAARS